MAKGSVDATPKNEGTRLTYVVCYEDGHPVAVEVCEEKRVCKLPPNLHDEVEIVECRAGFIALAVDWPGDEDEEGKETAYLFRTGQGRADRQYRGEPGESLLPWITGYWGV